MKRSTTTFDRWKPNDKYSWPLVIFGEHETEINYLYGSFTSASRYAYTSLKKQGADWLDDPLTIFPPDPLGRVTYFKDLKDWSNSFNELSNWIRLNSLLSVASYLEMYLENIISLAINSDLGLLFGTSRRIDGALMLKYGTAPNIDLSHYVTPCVRGTWSSRISAYKKLFGHVPAELKDNIRGLEEIRGLKNSVSHAFGRNIKKSRQLAVNKAAPVIGLSEKRMFRLFGIVNVIAKAIDKHLLLNHIGEYESILFYHNMKDKMPTGVSTRSKVTFLKKSLYSFNKNSRGKMSCLGLINYYSRI